MMASFTTPTVPPPPGVIPVFTQPMTSVQREIIIAYSTTIALRLSC